MSEIHLSNIWTSQNTHSLVFQMFFFNRQGSITDNAEYNGKVRRVKRLRKKKSRSETKARETVTAIFKLITRNANGNRKKSLSAEDQLQKIVKIFGKLEEPLRSRIHYWMNRQFNTRRECTVYTRWQEVEGNGWTDDLWLELGDTEINLMWQHVVVNCIIYGKWFTPSNWDDWSVD